MFYYQFRLACLACKVTPDRVKHWSIQPWKTNVTVTTVLWSMGRKVKKWDCGLVLVYWFPYESSSGARRVKLATYLILLNLNRFDLIKWKLFLSFFIPWLSQSNLWKHLQEMDITWQNFLLQTWCEKIKSSFSVMNFAISRIQLLFEQQADLPHQIDTKLTGTLTWSFSGQLINVSFWLLTHGGFLQIYTLHSPDSSQFQHMSWLTCTCRER